MNGFWQPMKPPCLIILRTALYLLLPYHRQKCSQGILSAFWLSQDGSLTPHMPDLEGVGEENDVVESVLAVDPVDAETLRLVVDYDTGEVNFPGFQQFCQIRTPLPDGWKGMGRFGVLKGLDLVLVISTPTPEANPSSSHHISLVSCRAGTSNQR